MNMTMLFTNHYEFISLKWIRASIILYTHTIIVCDYSEIMKGKYMSVSYIISDHYCQTESEKNEECHLLFNNQLTDDGSTL